MTASLKNLYTQIRKSLLERQKIVQILFLLLCTTITTNSLFAQSGDSNIVYSESDFDYSEVPTPAPKALSLGGTTYGDVTVTPSSGCYNGSTSQTISATATNHIYYRENFDNLNSWSVSNFATNSSNYSIDGNYAYASAAGAYIQLSESISTWTNVKVYFMYETNSSSVVKLQYSTADNPGSGDWVDVGSYTGDGVNWKYSNEVSINNNAKKIRFYVSSFYNYAWIDNFAISADVPATISWTNTGTAGTASGSTYTVTPASATNTFTATNSGSSPAKSASATLNVLKATISGTTSICNGNSTNLSISFTGTAPFRYRITGDSSDRTLSSGTSATISVSPSSTTTYQITKLEDAHCSNVSGSMNGSATITVMRPPTINTISAPSAICDGQKITAPSLTVTQNNGT